eukprot:g1983.t1
MASEKLFLSHAWAKDKLGRNNHERVARINKGLKERQINTWFDSQGDMQGNIMQAMTEGIEECSLVAVCITREYIEKCKKKDNDNCKLEFEYAYHRKKVNNLIAVVMEPDCANPDSWDGPVGAALASQLHVDCKGDTDADFEKALNEIEARIKKRTPLCDQDGVDRIYATMDMLDLDVSDSSDHFNSIKFIQVVLAHVFPPYYVYQAYSGFARVSLLPQSEMRWNVDIVNIILAMAMASLHLVTFFQHLHDWDRKAATWFWWTVISTFVFALKIIKELHLAALNYRCRFHIQRFVHSMLTKKSLIRNLQSNLNFYLTHVEALVKYQETRHRSNLTRHDTVAEAPAPESNPIG